MALPVIRLIRAPSAKAASVAFTNTYAEPPAPAQPGGKTFTPRGPIGKVLTQTGDDKLALVLPLAAVALAGAASIAALFIMRRRDKR